MARWLTRRRAGANLRANLRGRVQVILFALFCTLGIGSILAADLLLKPQVTILKGQAADKDIVAPYRIEFPSAILTQAEQQRAVAAVSEVYDPLDRQVGRGQVNLALQVLSFIDSVRADSFATPSYRRKCLESIVPVHLAAQTISDTLALDDAGWKTVQLETRKVLDEIMKREIKTGQEDARRREVRSLIGFDLTEAQTTIVDEIASALVQANRSYNAPKTESARLAATEAVKPVMRVLEKNEIIVRNGEIVKDQDIEALDALGLRNPSRNWLAVGSAFLVALLLSVAISAYLLNNEPCLCQTLRYLLLLLLLLLSFTFVAKWGIVLPGFQPYLVPLGTLGLLATVLFNARVGVAAHLAVCLAVGYVVQGQLDLFWYALVGGLVGVLVMRRAHRINTFIWTGVYITAANVVTVATFALLDSKFDTIRLGQLALAGAANGALTAIFSLGGYYLLGIVFQITTSLQLMDLTRPTHPLLRELLLKAPGTYHHSILVGNMAEQAAEAVGADALLSRVGAFYHDVGKTLRPYFFTENQMDGSNPHDVLDPKTSAQIIRNHTVEGVALARKYHLPRILQEFIAEHHGTDTISYFYYKAVQDQGAESVREDDYRHAGPRPQSKETTIVMLADTCEAAVRSIHPHNPEEIEKAVRKLITNKITAGQLNDAPLTLQEIETITLSFIDTLQGVFHPRIRYPSFDKKEAGQAVLPEQTEQAPALPGPGEHEREPETFQAIFIKEGKDDSSTDSTLI